MFRRWWDNIRAVAFSLAVHVALFALLILSFDWAPTPTSGRPKPKAVQAVVVDESKVEAEVKKLEEMERREEREEQARLEELRKKAAEADRKRQQEEQRLADLKKRQAEEARKREAEHARVEKLKKEQAALAKKRQEEEKRLAAVEAARKAEEVKRKEEEAKRKAAEAKRKEQEAKRKAAEAKRKEQEARRQREAELKEQLAAEENARREAAAQREIDKFVALIRDKVTRNWLRPAGAPKGLSCTVRVTTIPGGEVVRVQVIKSSGNAVFDRSAETAVYKASPLPLPSDPNVAARMRDVNFVFKPEG